MNKKFLSALIVGSFLASFNCLATERNDHFSNLAYKIKVFDITNHNPGLPGEVMKIIKRISTWVGLNNYIITLTDDEKNGIGYLFFYQETSCFSQHISLGKIGVFVEEDQLSFKNKNKNKNIEENDVINKLVPKLQKIYEDIDISKECFGDKKAAFLNLGFEEYGDALAWSKKSKK